MFTICDPRVSLSAGFARLAGLAACGLLAAACHGGLDTPAGPSAPGDAALSATSDDEAVPVETATVASTRRVTYEMAEANLSGHSGSCTLAGARLGFRLKAQGAGVPGTVIRFHLIRADGFRTTAIVDVSRQGTFRTDQELVTTFPPNAEVRCVLLSIDGALLAESTTFHAP